MTTMQDPVKNVSEVTPNDETSLGSVRAIYVGTGGDVAVEMNGGGTAVHRNMAAGWYPLRVRKILATGTTAADIVAWY